MKDLKGTEIGLPIESGSGENSIQLPLVGEEFSYIGSDKITHTYSNETTGNYSTNLSPQGKVEREYSLNVGYQNTLEFRDGETAGYTDGGAIIGYRNYSNSSSSFLTGAWNRALNSKQVLISGYHNVINDTQSSKTGCSSIFGGMNYLSGAIRNSMLVGYGLLNKGGFEYHFGKWNKPTEGVKFSIGNGEENYYFWKHKFTFDYQTLTKEMLSTYIDTNEIRHHPKHEECYYLYNNNDQTTISAGVLLLNSGDIREIDSIRYWVFDINKYDNGEDTQKLELNATTKLGVLKNSARSNAFQVTDSGTAQLIRKNNPTLADDDLLTKKEIEDYVTEKTNLNIENGTGENSLKFKETVESFTYKSVDTQFTFETSTTGVGAINLSENSKVDRNHFINVGAMNAITFDTISPNDADDGGAILGYKNITNSRGSSVFGAHNKMFNAPNGIIAGYQNTTTTTYKSQRGSINIGERNYLTGNIGDSALIGRGLKNGAHSYEYHIGRFNHPSYMGEDKIMFTIGNGSDNFIYQKRPNKPSLADAITHNEAHKYNPIKELWWYILKNDTYELITTNTTQADFDASDVYQYTMVGRSNALQVTTDGRAQLFQKEVDGAFIEKSDNDLLTKKEIQEEVDFKLASKYKTVWVNGAHLPMDGLQAGWYRFYINSMSFLRYGATQSENEYFDEPIQFDMYVRRPWGQSHGYMVGGYKSLAWASELAGIVNIEPNSISIDESHPRIFQIIRYIHSESGLELEDQIEFYYNRIDKINN